MLLLERSFKLQFDLYIYILREGTDKAFAVLQHHEAMFEHINIYELYNIYILLSNSQVDHKFACHFLVHVLHVLKHFGIAQQTQPMVDVVSLAFSFTHY